MKKTLFLLFFAIFLSFFCSNTICQTKYPKNYFVQPLRIPVSLSGNFGEIRPNHIHSGLDFKTDGKEGLPVYASADGYVSRIKVSPFGYGKAIYITHANGFTSVYAHLSTFNSPIAEYVKAQQYKNQSFEVELFPEKDKILIKQNDTIAYSGNTGGSSGPHLHFEIRDSKTEFPINPVLFGFFLRDKTPPTVTAIAIYPLDTFTVINGKNKTLFITVPPNKEIKDTVFVSGKIGFGIETYDTEEMNGNKNGTYNVKLYKDTSLIYEHTLDQFSFDNTRYVNAHMDYETKKKNGKTFQRCYLLPNNKLGIYNTIKNNGVLSFYEDSVYKIRFETSDYYELKTFVKLIIKSSNKCEKPIETEPDSLSNDSTNSKNFVYNKNNRYTDKDFSVDIPAFALYQNMVFKYKRTNNANFYSAIHHVHYSTTPLQKAIKITIKPFGVPDSLKQKAFIGLVNGNTILSFEGNIWNEGYISASTKSFGNFAVAIDTVAPEISFLKPKIKDTTRVEFKIVDQLTGIDSYKTTLNGNWVLMEYDAKTNRLIYFIDEYFKSNENTIEITVTDKLKNVSKQKFSFQKTDKEFVVKKI